jgi:hypothetical protein
VSLSGTPRSVNLCTVTDSCPQQDTRTDSALLAAARRVNSPGPDWTFRSARAAEAERKQVPDPARHLASLATSRNLPVVCQSPVSRPQPLGCLRGKNAQSGTICVRQSAEPTQLSGAPIRRSGRALGRRSAHAQ